MRSRRKSRHAHWATTVQPQPGRLFVTVDDPGPPPDRQAQLVRTIVALDLAFRTQSAEPAIPILLAAVQAAIGGDPVARAAVLGAIDTWQLAYFGRPRET